MQSTPLLQMPIGQLELSQAFKEMAVNNDFRNLQDIINWPASVLLLHKNFTYHIYQELRHFLNKNELLSLLKTEESQFI